MANSKIKAWDNLYEQNKHIIQYGYNHHEPISAQLSNLRDALGLFDNPNTSIAQVNALSEIIYWAYECGKAEMERKQNGLQP